MSEDVIDRRVGGQGRVADLDEVFNTENLLTEELVGLGHLVFAHEVRHQLKLTHGGPEILQPSNLNLFQLRLAVLHEELLAKLDE